MAKKKADPKNCSGCGISLVKCKRAVLEGYQGGCCPDCEHERGCKVRVWDNGDKAACGESIPCPKHG
jgi:hypothetical protein